jgi:hypothetical protein
MDAESLRPIRVARLEVAIHLLEVTLASHQRAVSLARRARDQDLIRRGTVIGALLESELRAKKAMLKAAKVSLGH